MNVCDTHCNHEELNRDSLEMSNLQRCNGVTIHGCGNPLYNIYAWDCAHPYGIGHHRGCDHSPVFECADHMSYCGHNPYNQCEEHHEHDHHEHLHEFAHESGCHKGHCVPASWLCSYLLKKDAAKIYATNKALFDLSNFISGTYYTKEDAQILENKVDTEIEDRQNADAILTTKINDLDVALNYKIGTEIERATTAEQTITDTLVAEVSRATATETALNNSLAAEVNRSTTAENTIANNLNQYKEEANGRLSTIERTMVTDVAFDSANHKVTKTIDGSVSTVFSLDTTPTDGSRNPIESNAVHTIQTQLTNTANSLQTEVTRATSMEQAINTALANEVTRATAAESAVQANVTSLSNRVNADLVHSADYDSVSKTIQLKNASGAIIDTIDATAFIKDGMVNSVEVIGNTLDITFNTDAGKSDIVIPITDIFDANNYYTKSDTTSLLNQKQNVITDLSTIRSGAAAGATAYQKSSTGIPKSDLEHSVQSSLEKADTALQTHQSLSDYYTKSDVSSLLNGKADKATTLAGYGITDAYTKNQVDTAIAGVQNAIPTDYYTQSQVDSKVNTVNTAVTNLANNVYSKSEADARYVTASDLGFDTGESGEVSPNIETYIQDTVTQSVNQAISNVTLSTYTKAQADSKFLTQHQSLDGYYTKSEVDNKIQQASAGITIDNTPTNGSSNAVSSGGVYTALNNKQDRLTFDSTPVANSTNPVTSGGVYSAIQAAAASAGSGITVDTQLNASSTNPVTNSAITTKINSVESTVSGHESRITALEGSASFASWFGTQSEYDAIETKDSNTLYYIIETS